MIDPYLFRDCPHCDATGRVRELSGEWARAQRKAAKLSLREVAKRLGVCAAYVSDLELGRRRFHQDIADRYVEALR